MHKLFLVNQSLSLDKTHSLEVQLLNYLFILKFLVFFVADHLRFDLFEDLLPYDLIFLRFVEDRVHEHPLSPLIHGS